MLSQHCILLKIRYRNKISLKGSKELPPSLLLNKGAELCLVRTDCRRNYLLISAFVFKVLHGTAHCESILTGVFTNPHHLESLTFRYLSARTDSLFHSPSHRVPRFWDTIPPVIREAAVICPLMTLIRLLKGHCLNHTYE